MDCLQWILCSVFLFCVQYILIDYVYGIVCSVSLFCFPKPLYTVLMICVISDLVVTDIFSYYVNFFCMWECCFATTSSVNYSLVSQVPAAALYRLSPKIFYFCFKMKNYSQYPNIKMIVSNTQVMIVMFPSGSYAKQISFQISKMANKIKILSLICNGLSDKSRRFLLLHTCIDNSEFVLVNLYAPTKDNPEEQKLFLNFVREHLCDFLGKMIIMGGDFNMNPELDKKKEEYVKNNQNVR